MSEKQFETARNNEQSPAKGFASVNTHNPDEEAPLPPQTAQPASRNDRPRPRPGSADRAEQE